MQLITALLFLAAGHAVRATNDAQCAALGDAARADVCACGAHFYAFAGEDKPVSCVDAQIFESVEATCDGDVEGVEFEDSSLPGLTDYYECCSGTPIENTTRDDQYRPLADADELLVLRRRGERRARPCCVPRGCRRKLHDFRQRRREMAEEDRNKKPSVTTDSLDDERPMYKGYYCAALLCCLTDKLSDMTAPVTCACVAVGGVCVATVTGYCYKDELQAWLQARLQARRSPTPPPDFGHGDPEENDGEQATQDESRGLTALADAARTDAWLTALADAADLQRDGPADAPPGDAGMPPPPTTESDAGAAGGLQSLADAARALSGNNDTTDPQRDGPADAPPDDATGAQPGDATATPPNNATGTQPRRSVRSKPKTPRYADSEWETPQRKKKARDSPWTEEAEEALRDYVDDFGSSWSNETELARRLPGRTPDACKVHWSLMVQRGDATRSNSTEARLNATIEAARKELARRRQAFGGMLTPAREGVLEAMGLVEERAKASLKLWRSLLVMRAKLGQRQRNKYLHRAVIAKTAADVETAEKAWEVSRNALSRALRDAKAVSDKYDLDDAKEVAGDNPDEQELAAIAALERKAQESRAATEAGRHAALNEAAATALASLDAALAADQQGSTRATQKAVQTAQAAYDAAFRKTDAGRESAAKEAAATARASLDAALEAHRRRSTDATCAAVQKAQAAYDAAFAKTSAGRARLRRAKKHKAEVLAAAVIEDTPPDELLSKAAELGDEVAAYALNEIRNGRVVYIGNSTAGGYEAEVEMVLRRDNFLIKEKGAAPVASSRLKIEKFSCETSAVLANLVERHAQIAVRNECGAEDILYSKAGAGGLHCKNVETVVYVFSIAPEAGDKRTPSPFECGEHDLSDLRRAVIAAAVSLTPMPEEHVQGVDVDVYLKKVDGDGVYHVFTRGPWCVRQWKPTPSSTFEFETTRLWPLPEVARAEAEEVFTKKTHANYKNGSYEKVGKADYADAMEADDSGPLHYRVSDMDTSA